VYVASRQRRVSRTGGQTPRAGAGLHLPRTTEKPIAARGIVRSASCPFRRAGGAIGHHALPARLATATLPLPMILGPRIGDGLPLEIGDGVRATASQRLNVILCIAGTSAACFASRRARMLPLELPRYLARSVLSRRGDSGQGQIGQCPENGDPTKERYTTPGHCPSINPSALRSLIAPDGYRIVKMRDRPAGATNEGTTTGRGGSPPPEPYVPA
jgi:hypothetical protein